MQIHHQFRSSSAKGITPVISTIMIVLIVISLTGFAYTWFSRTTSTTTNQIEDVTTQQVQYLGAKIKVEGLTINQLYIRNTGTGPVSNIVVYVDGVKIDHDNPIIQQGMVGTLTLNAQQLANQNGDGREIKVTGPGGTTARTRTDIFVALPTCTIIASPNVGIRPLTTDLTWSTTNNPTSCIASGGWAGSKNVAGGTQQITGINADTTFILTCSNALGPNTCQVLVRAGDPPTCALSANPAVVSGPTPLSSQITWTTANAPDSCTGTMGTASWPGDKVPAGGNQNINDLFVDTTFQMTCANVYGTGPVCSTTVMANPIPWYGIWQNRKEITIVGTQIMGSFTNFPLLIRLPSDANLASLAQDDGDDIVFTDSNEVVKIDHEIERFNGATGELVAWVKLPATTASTTKKIYMYYNNPSATNQQNPTAVWDSNYKIVHHFEDSTSPIDESTTNNNDAITMLGATYTASGLAAGAYTFDGTDDYLRVPASATWSGIYPGYTFELWIKPQGFNDFDMFYSRPGWGGTPALWTYASGFASSDLSTPGVCQAGLMLSYFGTPDSNYHNIVITYDGTTHRFYSDGVQVTSNSIPQCTGSIIQGAAADLSIGGANSGSRSILGAIDEFRISTGPVRTATWIATEFNNQKPTSNMITWSLQQDRP